MLSRKIVSQINDLSDIEKNIRTLLKLDLSKLEISELKISEG